MIVSNGLNLRIGGRLMGAGAFNPASLFVGSDGLLLDMARMDTMSQDSAGSTPLTGPGQPVGRVLDLSGRGRTASQSVSASRPTLGRHPASGRRNLLTWTDDMTNAIWGKSAGVTVTGGQADPFGGTTAVRVQFSAPGQAFIQYISSGIPTGSALFGGIWVKGLPVETIRTRFFSSVEPNVALTGEWQYISRATTSEATSDNFNISTFGGATARDVLVCRPQLVFGSSDTPYQRVTTQYDVTEPGQPNVWYGYIDAADDALTVTVPAGGWSNATVALATDAGVSILTGQTIPAGAWTLPLARPSRCYGIVVINRPLTGAETTILTRWLNAKRGS